MQSRLARQLAEAAAAVHDIEAPFALIGGLALASHGVVRGTIDIDFLVDAAAAERVERLLVGLGYRPAHRSEDAATYIRADERVDLLYAHRPIALALLAQAREVAGTMRPLRVVSAEGLVAFKLQGLVNDPRRTQDLEDIRALLRANRASLDMAEVRGYFRLFDREGQLDELLDEIR